jgi:hypothetical protein
MIVINETNEVLSKLKSYTVRNSPYYGRDITSLTSEQIEEHNKYVDADARFLEGIIRMNDAMEQVHRDYIKKSNGSTIGAQDCYVDYTLK